MNAVEIEEAVSALAVEPYDASEFPFAFLEAFGNKATTIKRLRKGDSNNSDLPTGVLQQNHIHLATCEPGEVTSTLAALRDSPQTSKRKAKFILATDGQQIEAESLADGATIACDYSEISDHFGFFLPLAGITTVRAIQENSFDIKATARLNKLYLELLKDNPDWSSDDRREDFNHFMARLIFCYFAEDTGIFPQEDLFTATVEQMSAPDSSNTHEVIAELFRAMNTHPDQRGKDNIKSWADCFPYVNGGLFGEGTPDVPVFSKIARSYLIHVGNLDWTKINPDIFGSMVQAIADDSERGSLGMHYTSVPNILKVLNPLFLDDLRSKLEDAGDNKRKLLYLRKRLARIRVFDPACGSGNFLVIAYKEMRAIEAKINQLRGESDHHSVIPLTNFRGIEISSFSAEIARLALVIAEFQGNTTHLGTQEAKILFLPLEKRNWITCGNALRLDWLSICPPTGTTVKNRADDLFETPMEQSEIDFQNEGGETYICGNPPYAGRNTQSPEQKNELTDIVAGRAKALGYLDIVAGWFMKAADYCAVEPATCSFVATNSICQGSQVPTLWPIIYSTGCEIVFAHTSFKWANLAANNAGVTVVIVGISNKELPKKIFTLGEGGKLETKDVISINPYLIPGRFLIVEKRNKPGGDLAEMLFGNKPTDGGHLILETTEKRRIIADFPKSSELIKGFLGSAEFIRGSLRFCLWIEDQERENAEAIPPIAERINGVAEMRAASKAAQTRPAAEYPHRFRQIQATAEDFTIIVPAISSENRDFLPVGLLPPNVIISNKAYALYDAPLWNMALIASRIHWVWIATVCVRMRTDFSYSNTLGWNTFPVPPLTEQNKADLTRCAEDILLAREAHFPATIADLYKPEAMPENLRAAHQRNDETLERIYIGRRFKNDTERLEHLFQLYTEMTAAEASA